ncbi:mitochondrial ATP synthase g subunit-domain-containing protein [Pilobolus umbonatus]|nr:mitochondrial ATP synthase g subunit-domain-containing protein [Pilobolus umbonatus]
MASKILSHAQSYVNKFVALQRPIVYQAKVAAEVAKQVYVKEGMAFPTGNQFQQAQQTIKNTLKVDTLKNLSIADVAKGSVILAEVYTFFLVGEIVGRRNFIGYDVSSGETHEH